MRVGAQVTTISIIAEEDERSLKLQLPVAVLSARKSERMLTVATQIRASECKRDSMNAVKNFY